ncbi:carbamoyltransferase [Verticiella sediminum]|uniref:Carbamoyltransferase n=1 Tax=Verticiella sediminum TaxID=1247510 RepID=A0A556AF48_9BURK|nr:carbamoyltransferase C-terminal domain-containing protein [Verticiella sediminum]TSH91512.1 carbamoyltransferase [Verticiella sediminum]
MHTLGINAAYHDCSAALVRDGQVIAAAEEERFTHIKHGKRPLPFTTWQLPFHAIDYCLAEAGLRLADVDHIAYAFDPWLLPEARHGADITLPLEPSAQRGPTRSASPWDPLFLSYIANAPRQLASGAPHHLQARFKGVDTAHVQARWRFVEHHLAHEASAYLSAPFDEAAVLTMDGRGEIATTSYGVFRDGRYQRLKQVDLPHSLGLLYEEVTDYLGFLRSSDEYKVMALASYGEPRYLDEFRQILRADGEGGYTVAAPELVRRFGAPRARGGPLEQRHYDIAHSLQKVLEETVAGMVRWLHAASGARHLCMAGGVALNCVLNARVLRDGPFEDVWVQPAAGDAGTALGAALWLDRELAPRPAARWVMHHAYLGPAQDDDEIRAFLDRAKLPYRRMENVAEEVAERLARGEIVGWHQGRMEFGPRALGARSILASPIDPDMQARLNDIKDREDFRPVAPAVMQEHAHEWFAAVRPGEIVAPFMLFVFDVLDDKAARIPAVRHVDGTARVQTVRRDQHPLYYELLAAFYRRTGVPVLVNTSFNTRGEPVVCTPRDSIECFWTSPLDVLAIGSFLLEKRR